MITQTQFFTQRLATAIPKKATFLIEKPKYYDAGLYQWKFSTKSRTLCRNFSSSIKINNSASTQIKSESVTNSSKENPFKKYFKFRYLSLGIFTVGFIFYNTNPNFHDLSHHLYLTAGRVKVVAKATFNCFYHYKKTLGLRDGLSEEEYDEELKKCHKKCALITLDALEKNGGIYIKLGQHIGAMGYLLPPEWTDTMVPLQDHCPVSSFDEINLMFKTDLHLPNGIEDMFDQFDPLPIGAASLAQVHVATLKKEYGGQKVAVKCQHPSLKEFVPLDVMLTQSVFNLLDIVFPEYPLSWLGDEMQQSIFVELNFLNEAVNAKKTQEYFNSDKKFLAQTALKIPDVIEAHKRILIMEYCKGARLDNLKYMDEHNISRSEVSSCVSNIFNNMIFTPNVGIHCDPHGGNIAIRAIPKSGNGHNFEILLYDHGLYRYPETQLRRDYAKFWLSLLDNDIPNMKKYAKAFANINDEEFPLFCAAITGRSINTVLTSDITKAPKSTQEIEEMKSRFLNDNKMLTILMSILAKVPRIVILILKTNDLTRHLDECLKNPLGPERTFLILTQYCSKTVFDETKENIAKKHHKWSIMWIWSSLANWCTYEKRMSQLYFYDFSLWLRNIVHKLD
ncbi:ABC1 protein mcp2 [Hanseniaspora vineae]